MIAIKSYSKDAIRNMQDHRSHVHARAQNSVEDYVERVCAKQYRGTTMSSHARATLLVSISIFKPHVCERLCLCAAHSFKRNVVDDEFVNNMGKYVDNGDAWMPRTYRFLGNEDQASMRAVAKYGVDHNGRDNVDRQAMRLSAQNIYDMVEQVQPLGKRLELVGKMRKIMCGIKMKSAGDDSCGI